MAWTYRLEFVDCGKPRCRKLHGPYWYAYEHRGGRMAKRYIGKKPRADWSDRVGWESARGAWESEERAARRRGVATAADYAAIDSHPGDAWDELRRAYRAAIRRAHPDAGGSTAAAVKVNLAWERIQRARSATKGG